ncbi:hypothetical protein ACIPWL_20015 [Streptomyces sp. NPDC090023]|uniref:hypothetical protein n=1 Tax=unclassified Streptomyces TaxID=2593676 RepID=UPI0037FB8E65
MGLWSTLAYVAGSHISTVYDEVVRYQRYVLIAAGILVAALVVRHLVRRRRVRRTGEGP